MARRAVPPRSPYEQKVAGDMETTVLRFGKDLAGLVDDLRHAHRDERRAVVRQWMLDYPSIAALVLDELASFLDDLVSAASKVAPCG